MVIILVLGVVSKLFYTKINYTIQLLKLKNEKAKTTELIKDLQKEVVKIYFGKDLVEKAFRTLKGITQIRPVRHWLEERVKAHIFICYLSYLLLSLLQLKLKKTEFNAINALEELDTMYKVHIKDPKTKNTFTKTVALTKKQEDILKAVNKNLLKECSDQKTLQT